MLPQIFLSAAASLHSHDTHLGKSSFPLFYLPFTPHFPPLSPSPALSFETGSVSGIWVGIYAPPSQVLEDRHVPHA